MKYYIIAGEASGDMHAANLMKQLKLRDKEAHFRVWGGDKMQEEADEMVKHFRDTSFMGIFKVLWNIRTIKRNFRLCEKDIATYRPEVLILIDNSGFNLPIAKFSRALGGIRIYYYIAPQAWAWKKKRVHTIHQYCHRVFTILPFEQAFYRSYGYEVDYVGHPILDVLEKRKKEVMEFGQLVSNNNLSGKPLIALLPGSRKQEIKTKLPIMLKVVKHFPNYQFVIAGSTNFNQAYYEQFTHGQVKVLFDSTYHLLNNAKAALVTSGTATLEAALFKVPQVVCYKPGYVTYQLLKKIVSIKFISLVNIILDKLVVKELIEGSLNEKQLKYELNLILSDKPSRERIMKDYERLEQKLGGTGASVRTAELMYQDILQNQSLPLTRQKAP